MARTRRARRQCRPRAGPCRGSTPQRCRRRGAGCPPPIRCHRGACGHSRSTQGRRQNQRRFAQSRELSGLFQPKVQAFPSQPSRPSGHAPGCGDLPLTVLRIDLRIIRREDEEAFLRDADAFAAVLAGGVPSKRAAPPHLAMRSEPPELAGPPKRRLGALATVSWPWAPARWNRLGETVKTRKKREKQGEKGRDTV